MKKYFSFAGLVAALAILPSLHIISSLKMYDEKRLFEIALLSVIGLFFIWEQFIVGNQNSSLGRSMLRPYSISLYSKTSIAIFFGLGVLSLSFNAGWYHGLQELSLYLLLLVLFFYVAKTYLLNSKQFEQGIALLLLLLGGLYALKFVIGYGMHMVIDYPLWPGKNYQYKFFGFANIRFFNQVQAWTLPLFLIWEDRKNPPRVSNRWRIGIIYFFFALAAFWWCLVIQSAGRGALLSLLTAPLIVLVCFKEKSHHYIKKYLYSLATGVMLKILLFNILAPDGVSKSLARDSGSAGRFTIWSKVLKDVPGSPWLGYGPMSLAKIRGHYHVGHPHNSVLQIAYEFGLPALVIALGLIFWGGYKWYKQSKKINSNVQGNSLNIRIGISISLLAGLGYSLFSGVIVMPLSQLWMVVIAAWAFGMYYYSNDSFYSMGSVGACHSTSVQGRRWVKLLLSGLILGGVLWVGIILWHDMPKLKENQQVYIKKYSHTYRPRFWQQGKIGIKR